ncbi:MAG: hypothetical protein ACRC7G_06645, partial [Beijerinckiaceae bacterium]
NGEPVASAVSDAWAKMGRRNTYGEGEPARVAFFPSAAAAGVRSDAVQATPGPAQGTAVNVQLPPERPRDLAAAATELVAKRSKRPRDNATGQPLDLMRFLKPGLRT